MKCLPIRHKGNRAFSLVEVTLALGVMVFALFGLVGLIPIGLDTQRCSIQQTAATNIATAIVSDLRQTPPPPQANDTNSSAWISQTYGVDISSRSEQTFFLDAQGSLLPSADRASYRAVVLLRQAPTEQPRIATVGRITIGWPASTPKSMDSVCVLIALDKN